MNVQNQNLKEKYESQTGYQGVILLCNQMIKSVSFIDKVKNIDIQGSKHFKIFLHWNYVYYYFVDSNINLVQYELYRVCGSSTHLAGTHCGSLSNKLISYISCFRTNSTSSNGITESKNWPYCSSMLCEIDTNSRYSSSCNVQNPILSVQFLIR